MARYVPFQHQALLMAHGPAPSGCSWRNPSDWHCVQEMQRHIPLRSFGAGSDGSIAHGGAHLPISNGTKRFERSLSWHIMNLSRNIGTSEFEETYEAELLQNRPFPKMTTFGSLHFSKPRSAIEKDVIMTRASTSRPDMSEIARTANSHWDERKEVRRASVELKEHKELMYSTQVHPSTQCNKMYQNVPR